MVWATGQKLQGGKYVIQGVLGQGGFGITYKARHVSLNHYVVIKTPNEYLQYEPRVVPCLHFLQFTGKKLFVLQTIRLLGNVLEQPTRKAKTIPWVRLTVIAGCYLVIGFFFAVAVARAWALTFAVPVAVAVVWAVPVDAAAAVAAAAAAVAAVAVAWTGAGTVAAVLFGAVAAAWTGAVAVPVAVAGAWAREKLQESFSKFHTFLILLGTSWLGLGLGWLLGSIL